jgi:sugar phosphate isomerase/epimerase
MSYSISTSWNSKLHKTGRGIVDDIKKTGLDTIELNFALTENVVCEILSIRRSGGIKVSSLHNMCPLPAEITGDNPSPDHYSIASPDGDERALAVRIARNTIDYAKKFDAKAIVLHAGRVEIKDRTHELVTYAGDKARFDIIKKEMASEREFKKAPHIESVMKSLDELGAYAKASEIRIGIENRYHHREIPSMCELEIIFENFRSDNIGYWHDTGHAEAFERLGFCKHKELLDKFSSRLIGIHIHDIIGMTDDHKAPGSGTFDFRMLKPYMQGDLIKVLEVHQPATAREIRCSVEYLDKVLR